MGYSIISVLSPMLPASLNRLVYEPLKYNTKYHLIMQTQNTIDASSITKNFEVPIVVVIGNMFSFYNLDMFVQDIRMHNPRTQFILLTSSEHEPLGTGEGVNSSISSVLDMENISENELIYALDKAAATYDSLNKDAHSESPKDWQEYYRDLMFKNNLILSCLNNNISVNNIPAELKTLADTSFTVLLGETTGNPEWNFYGQSPEMLLFFIDKIQKHISSPNSFVLLPSDHKLCMIFQSKVNPISEVVGLCEYINRICNELGFPLLKFSCSDSNDNILMLPHIYRNIDAAMKYHFFSGNSLVIFCDWLEKKKKAMPDTLSEKITTLMDTLYMCFKESKRALLERSLFRVQTICQNAYSFNLYYFVWNQLYFLYHNELRDNRHSSFGSPILYPANAFDTAEEAFKFISHHILALYDQVIEFKRQNGGSQLDAVKDFLIDHLSENYKMTEVAAAFNFSPSYFSRLFKSEYGESFSTYNNRFRIEEAKKLLDGALPVHEVAAMVGFTDTKYFSKLFRQYAGMSPMAYKTKLSSDREAGAK